MDEQSIPGDRVTLWGRVTAPIRRMWDSDDPLDDYAFVHMASAGGDGLVGLALADSVFFSLPLDQAGIRVASYLALTMAPLAVAGPLLVPLLDRGRFLRTISFVASAGRAAAVFFAAGKVDSLALFPATFAILVLSKVQSISKNGLTAAYAEPEGLVTANARLGRAAVAGVALALAPGLLLLSLGGARGVLILAGLVYVVAALLNLQLDRREVLQGAEPSPLPATRGRIPELAVAAAGTATLRAAQGFLVFLLAFGLRRAGLPTFWLGVGVGAGLLGALLGDLVAPRLSAKLREEAVVLGSLVGAGIAAFLAFQVFSLGTLALFCGLSGMATEFGRLSFQSLMQRRAPGGAYGRVFVRYEVAFQLAWVGGAFVAAIVPVSLTVGLVLLAVFDVVLGVFFLVRPRLRREP